MPLVGCGFCVVFRGFFVVLVVFWFLLWSLCGFFVVFSNYNGCEVNSTMNFISLCDEGKHEDFKGTFFRT